MKTMIMITNNNHHNLFYRVRLLQVYQEKRALPEVKRNLEVAHHWNLQEDHSLLMGGIKGSTHLR